MHAIIAGLLAIIFYLTASWHQASTLFREKNRRSSVLIFGVTGAIAHLVNVYFLIITPSGYDLGFYTIATLFSWTMVALTLIGSLKRPLDNLLVLLLPLAIISILFATLAPSTFQFHEFSTGVGAHILLAILAYSTITIAALQALLLAFQNHQLKDRHSLRFIQRLPPLQTMETLLFEILWCGLALLSLVIASGLIFMNDLYTQHLTHKLALSVVAWLIFAILLWGRHRLGWRGLTAIRWTLTGFVFLVLAYFGSKFVLELILNRA